MRVAAFTDFGGPDNVEVLRVDDPEPGPGETVVDVGACSINRHDLWILEGESAMVDEETLPFVSGLDLAGTVASVGEGVNGIEPGQQVVLCPNLTCGVCRYCREGPENRCEEFGLYHGGLAERALVDANRLIARPDDLTASEAAALPTAYTTAWHMLQLADVQPGDVVFVPGATGGVGVAAVQLAGVLGASTIVTSRSRTKLDRVAELGAVSTVRSSDPDEITERVLEIARPDAVINHLGGEFTRAGLDVLKRNGSMVVCGRTAGPRSEIDIAPLYLDHQRILGSTMGTQPELERLVDLAAAGDFQPLVGTTYDLDETSRAFETMQSRSAFGKLVVRP